MPEEMQVLIDISENKEFICPKCGSSCVPISLSCCNWQTNQNQNNEQINVKGFHCISCDITYEEK